LSRPSSRAPCLWYQANDARKRTCCEIAGFMWVPFPGCGTVFFSLWRLRIGAPGRLETWRWEPGRYATNRYAVYCKPYGRRSPNCGLSQFVQLAAAHPAGDDNDRYYTDVINLVFQSRRQSSLRARTWSFHRATSPIQDLWHMTIDTCRCFGVGVIREQYGLSGFSFLVFVCRLGPYSR